MKLIVVGATGFVGTEVIRQALRNPAVTSVIALARKPVLPPGDSGPHTDPSKLHSVVLEDWISPYPESVMEYLKGANACIWLVTPVHNSSILT
jgi:nucleoside-diphosphate-sugar epimerase